MQSGEEQLKIIETTLAALAQLLVWAAGLFLLAMALHVCADVAMKYLFNRPIPGTAEIVARYYMLAAVFLPLPFVEMRNTGISVDLFYNMFGAGWRRAMILIAYAGQTVFFSLLAYQTGIDAMRSFAKNEFIDGQIIVHIWPATFFLPVAFGLAAAVSVLRIVQVLLRRDWEEVTASSASLDVWKSARRSA